MNAIRVLLWKEWREQRLTLLFIGLIIVCAGIGASQTRDKDPHLEVLFCCFAIGQVVGAAGAETEARALAFLSVKPVPIPLVWAAKSAFSVVAVGVTVAAVLALAKLPVWHTRAPLMSDEAVVWMSLFSWGFAQYSAGWTRSPVTSIGLGLVLGACLVGMAALNPIEAYLSPVQGHLALAVCFAVLLAISRAAFLRAARSEYGFSKRQALGWFLLPVALLGLLPLGVGVVTLIVDDRWLDPTDVAEFRPVSVSSSTDRLLLSAQPADRFWLGASRWWGWWRGFPSLISISLQHGQARRILVHDLARYCYLVATVSPSGRRLVVALRPTSLREYGPRWLDGGFGPLVILDLATGAMEALPLTPGSWLRGQWLSEDRLMFYFAAEQGGTHGWGTWDAPTKKLTTFPNPCRLTVHEAGFSGFLPDPVRLVFADWHARSTDGRAHVYLLRADTGDFERLALPAGYRCGQVCPGGPLALLWPLTDRTPDAPRPSPRLLNLATGKDISLEAILGGAPEGGWERMSCSVSSSRPWLFAYPTDERRRMTAPGWHAVDLRSLTVVQHSRPMPLRPLAVSPTSDWCAHIAETVDTLIAFPLRDPDPSKRIVITRAMPSAGFSVRDGQMWLSDHEIALCVQTWGDGESRLFKRGPWRRAGVFVADLRGRAVRPLWPADGLGLQWRIMSWTEWQRRWSGALE